MSTAKARHARVMEHHFAGAQRLVMRLLRVFETIAVFLASPLASKITGQAVSVNGGISAA